MPHSLNTLIEQLGWPGKVAIALFAGVAIFIQAALRPLEIENQRLDKSLERATKQLPSANSSLIRTASPSAKLAAFYQFFRREEVTTDWLAKLHAVAEGSGVEMRIAEYQLVKGPGKLDRYEIALPLAGDYAQIRAFLENALLQIPVLSLDQVNFRRKRVNDLSVETDIRFTLHMLRP